MRKQKESKISYSKRYGQNGGAINCKARGVGEACWKTVQKVEDQKFGIAHIELGLPRWLSGKEPACQAGDMGLIPGLGKSPGEGNGNPLQYSCLGNLIDKGAWWAIVHGIAKS